jgi:hypothetical protein
MLFILGPVNMAANSKYGITQLDRLLRLGGRKSSCSNRSVEDDILSYL